MRAYGEVASIGFIGPPRTNGTVLHEAYRLAPDGVTWIWSTMGLPEFGQTEFDEALATAQLCAKQLADRQVSVIVMTGIPLMTSKGAPFHEQMEREITQAVGGRVPVTSDLNCVIAALNAMNMKNIAVTSIYQRYIQDNMIRYFQHYGIKTVADEALSYALADCMTKPAMNTSYDVSADLLKRTPGVDGLYISCPQWPVIDNIEKLERDFNIPVVTHLTAIMWGALAHIGIKAPVQGFGRMLREPPVWEKNKTAAA